MTCLWHTRETRCFPTIRSAEVEASVLQSLGSQVLLLFVLAIPVACISWTVTHEEIFREAREFCQDRSQHCRVLYQRKFFYVFTCEYCFSHYVTAALLFVTRFTMVFDSWRGYLIAGFSLVWVANFYMAVFGRLTAGDQEPEAGDRARGEGRSGRRGSGGRPLAAPSPWRRNATVDQLRRSGHRRPPSPRAGSAGGPRQYRWMPPGCLCRSHGGQIGRRYALRQQVIAHCAGALLGELLVVLVAADAIGVAFQLDLEAGISQQNAGDLGHLFAGAGLQRVLVEVEQARR